MTDSKFNTIVATVVTAGVVAWLMIAGNIGQQSRAQEIAAKEIPEAAVRPVSTGTLIRALDVGETVAIDPRTEVTRKAEKGRYTAKVYLNARFALDSKSGTYQQVASERITGDETFRSGLYQVIYTPLHDSTDVETWVKRYDGLIKEDVVLTTSKATKLLRWRVTTNAAVVEQIGGEIVYKNSRGDVLFRTLAPTAVDVNGNEVAVDVAYEAGILTYDVQTTKGTRYPVTVDPTTTSLATADGFLESRTDAEGTSRQATTALTSGTSIRVGRRHHSYPPYKYETYRSHLSFPVPAFGADTSYVNSVSLKLDGVSNNSTDYEFDIYAVASTYGSTLDLEDFDQFDGWHSSTGTYTGTLLTDTFNSASYSSGWNELPFNDAGRDSFLAAAGDTLRLCLLSERDYSDSSMAATEWEAYVTFNGSATASYEPYLEIDYVSLAYNTEYTTTHDAETMKTQEAHADSYETARDITNVASIRTGDADSLGQYLSSTHRIYKVSMIIPDLPEMNVLEAGSLTVNVIADQSTVDFTIEGRAGNANFDDDESAPYYAHDGRLGGLSPYSGDNLFETFSTSGLSVGEITLVFSEAGLAYLTSCSDDTARIVLMSSRTVSATEPTAAEYIILDTTDPDLTITWALNDSLPADFEVTPVNEDTLMVTWRDRCLDETGYRLVNLADTSLVAGTDTTAADAETLYVGGLDPNTLYRWMIQTVGGTYADSLSAPDSTYTDAYTPGAPTVSNPAADSLNIKLDVNANPAYTEFAALVITSAGSLLVDVAGDSLRAYSAAALADSTWPWGTYADFGSASGITVPSDIGKTYTVKVKARSGQ